MPDDQMNGSERNDINQAKRPSDEISRPEVDTVSAASDPSVPDSSPADTGVVPTAKDSQFSDSELASVEARPVVPSPAFDTEPATQGPVSPLTTEAAFIQPAPQEKKSKKKLIIGGIIAALLVLGLGGSAAAYNFWYQAPEKVLTDAATNLIQARAVVYDGTLTFESKDGNNKLLVTFDGQADRANHGENVDVKLTVDKKTYPLKASFMQTEDVTFYFKLDNLTETVKSYQEEDEVLPPAAVNLLEKIDGQWVKVTLEDLKDWAQEYADTQKCVGEVFRSVKNDDAKYKEIADVYAKHPFVTLKGEVETKDGNLGFDLDVDSAKQKAFVTGLNDTQLMKKLQKCDDSYKLDPKEYEEEEKELDEKSNTRVYISQWTHELRQVVSTFEDDENKGEFNLKPRFVDSVDVKAPSKAMTIQELQKMIDDVQQELYGGVEAEAVAETTEA